MSSIDYPEARRKLDAIFSAVMEDDAPGVEQYLSDYCDSLDAVFSSKTQSYREVLLGCALARLIDEEIDIRRPYVKQEGRAFNGRTLDENVINPFFQENLIPCSKGPYLAIFRRNVMLTEETRSGLRDKTGYDAMLVLLSAIENTNTEQERLDFVGCLLKRFAILRDQSRVPLAKINRLSIEQYRDFLNALMRCQSGGLLPVLASVALFQTVDSQYKLNWDISWQGINAADGATGAEGDVTVKQDGEVYIAIEITERPIDSRRVVSTFNTKILHSDARNYLFIYTNTAPDDTALQTAKSLFSQGYDINFANLVDIIIQHFMVCDGQAREIFTNKMLLLLDSRDVPASVKISWNNSLQALLEL